MYDGVISEAEDGTSGPFASQVSSRRPRGLLPGSTTRPRISPPAERRSDAFHKLVGAWRDLYRRRGPVD